MLWLPILMLQGSDVTKVEVEACRRGWNFSFCRGVKVDDNGRNFHEELVTSRPSPIRRLPLGVQGDPPPSAQVPPRLPGRLQKIDEEQLMQMHFKRKRIKLGCCIFHYSFLCFMEPLQPLHGDRDVWHTCYPGKARRCLRGDGDMGLGVIIPPIKFYLSFYPLKKAKFQHPRHAFPSTFLSFVHCSIKIYSHKI